MDNWIKVEDRLPDDGQKVWTFIPTNEELRHWADEVTSHTFHVEYGNAGGPWWIYKESHGNNYLLEDGYVTHWQSLKRPDPPSGR